MAASGESPVNVDTTIKKCCLIASTTATADSAGSGQDGGRTVRSGSMSPVADWPSEPRITFDAVVRAAAVMEFIADHAAAEELREPRPQRSIAEWVAILGSHIGRAAHLMTGPTLGPDELRMIAAWLACSSADSVRACSAIRARPDGDGDRGSSDRDIDELRVALIAALEQQADAPPATQLLVAFRALGSLAAATLISTAQRDDDGPRVLDACAELAACTAAGAVTLHPGGPVVAPLP